MKRKNPNQLHFFLYFAKVLLPSMQEEAPSLDLTFHVIAIKKKREKKKEAVVQEPYDGKTVIEVEGIRTTVEIYEKTVHGELKFVTKIERIYPDGKKYEEPEHFWPTHERARLDAKDWVHLGRKTDW